MTQLKLYIDRFWISPYSFSSYVALKEKQLDFELVEVALDKGEQKQDFYRKNSMSGRIPALQEGDFWLCESNAMAEYLDEAFPQGTKLMPNNLQERARARMVMGFLRTDLYALREERSTVTMFYNPSKVALSSAAKVDVQRLIDFAEALLGKSGRTQLFDQWSLADAELSFMLHRLILNKEELPEHLRKYAQTQWQRPSVQEFVQHSRVAYVAY